MAVGLMVAAAVAALMGGAMMAMRADGPPRAVVVEHEWMNPGDGRAWTAEAAITALAGRSVVILGESHDAAADHRWQLGVLTALRARRPGLAIGFEAFPRRAQPILDAWVAGLLGESEFLEQVRWDEVWGFDPEFYLPLFRFARRERLPMVALNVERGLVRKVGRVGWAAIAAAEREGLGEPAPAPAAYRARLRAAHAHHRPGGAMADDADPAFDRFVAAQRTWDRAMAEAIAAARAADGRLVVAIIGRGHAEYGHGVPHQLRALGVSDVAVALTWPAGTAPPPPDEEGVPVADFLYGSATDSGAAAR